MHLLRIWGFLALGLALACTPPAPQQSEAAPEETTTLPRWQEEHQLFRAGYADSINAGLIPVDTFRGSARREAQAQLDGATVTVNYGAPGKRGRVLWNGLVSYDQVWVSGSHWATAVTFGADVQIGETVVPAGMYGFFTIPGRESWTLIVNSRFDQHLADEYQAGEDLVRMTVTPTALDNVVQRLTYTVQPTGPRSGEILLAWDQVQVALPFSLR